MSTRLEEIQSFIEMAPSDPFPRYGLAMEYKNLGDLQNARSAFESLLASHPDYVPQYLMYGQMLVEMGDRPAAKKVLSSGVERAQKARNSHAQGELQSALDRLEDSADDD
jgi:hypothetical protein